MTYKVNLSNNKNYSVKLSSNEDYKVTLGYKIEVMPQNLNQLSDVEIDQNLDKYVLMYDATSGKWKNVNPNTILSAASNTETTQPGLPSDFLNTLDIDLDNRIDVDAGEF